MPAAELVDFRLAAIGARVLNARASTDGLVVALAADLDYLLARLLAAEAAALAGEAYAIDLEPCMAKGDNRLERVGAQDDRRAFIEALGTWRAAR